MTSNRVTPHICPWWESNPYLPLSRWGALSIELQRRSAELMGVESVKNFLEF